MPIATSRKVGPALLEALGISSKRCRSAVIKLDHNDVVMVQAEYYAEEPVGGELGTIFKGYRLVEIDSGASQDERQDLAALERSRAAG